MTTSDAKLASCSTRVRKSLSAAARRQRAAFARCRSSGRGWSCERAACELRFRRRAAPRGAAQVGQEVDFLANQAGAFGFLKNLVDFGQRGRQNGAAVRQLEVFDLFEKVAGFDRWRAHDDRRGRAHQHQRKAIALRAFFDDLRGKLLRSGEQCLVGRLIRHRERTVDDDHLERSLAGDEVEPELFQKRLGHGHDHQHD